MTKLAIRTNSDDPMLSLRDAMDRLLNDSFVRPFWPSVLSAGSFSLDMYETDDSVVVKAEMSGIKPEDINITVNGDLLTIRGETKQEEEVKEATYHVRERQQGAFSRTMTLPVPVVADKAAAEFEHGVLTLTLPKAEEVKPKVITVKARNGK